MLKLLLDSQTKLEPLCFFTNLLLLLWV